MLNAELVSDRVARMKLEARRGREEERRGRIFNEKERTNGVDKEALDMQVEEKKRSEEAEKEEQMAYDADVLQHSKAALLLQQRQARARRAAQTAALAFRGQQDPGSDPDPQRDPDPAGADLQMILPGLAGEDPESGSRRGRQREQQREWLAQQQDERQAERQRLELEALHYEQTRLEMNNKAAELQSLEMEKRREAAMETKNYNLMKVEEKLRQKQRRHEAAPPEGPPPDVDAERALEGGGSPESLQQLRQIQKQQMEEKKRVQIQEQQQELQWDRARTEAARRALLLERQQARRGRQLRKHLDSTNVQLARAQRERKPDLERGTVDESFFSQFNTCSR
ncbi:RIB43A-like with coiled-coils protein 2 [Menidia menidia]